MKYLFVILVAITLSGCIGVQEIKINRKIMNAHCNSVESNYTRHNVQWTDGIIAKYNFICLSKDASVSTYTFTYNQRELTYTKVAEVINE